MFAVIIFAASSYAGDALKIRVGADSSSFSYQFRVAEGAGIFEKYDIDAEVLKKPSRTGSASSR
jgi:hypothetical protein